MTMAEAVVVEAVVVVEILKLMAIEVHRVSIDLLPTTMECHSPLRMTCCQAAMTCTDKLRQSLDVEMQVKSYRYRWSELE